MARLLLGAIAGICGTALMTAGMRILHRRLSEDEAYPLPPREITERVLSEPDDEASVETATIAAHFAYGAVMGSLVAVAPAATRPVVGAAYGLLIWTGSYLGWIPASRILKSATLHPARRNAVMAAVHLIWGAGTSLTLRELLRAQSDVFGQGELRDAPPEQPSVLRRERGAPVGTA